jgi:serine protease inhibitor ecotin
VVETPKPSKKAGRRAEKRECKQILKVGELIMKEAKANRNLIRSGNTIYVTVPTSVAYDYNKMDRITKTVLGKLGCEGCHSGFDIRFLNESRFRFNEKLELIDEVQF